MMQGLPHADLLRLAGQLESRPQRRQLPPTSSLRQPVPVRVARHKAPLPGHLRVAVCASGCVEFKGSKNRAFAETCG